MNVAVILGSFTHLFAITKIAAILLSLAPIWALVVSVYKYPLRRSHSRQSHPPSAHTIERDSVTEKQLDGANDSPSLGVPQLAIHEITL